MKIRRMLLKTLIAVTLLSALMVSTFLGVTKAEYFKSFKKKIDLEMSPDMKLEYYLYDGKERNLSEFTEKRGSYEDDKGFIQWIQSGTATSYNGKYNAENVVYQVKIPVSETGYYTLDFYTFMRLGKPTENYESSDFYTISYTKMYGCEVLNSSDGVEFGSKNKINLAYRIYDANVKKSYTNERVVYADSVINKNATTNDSVYQWKSLCPYRAENVSLTFKAEVADVEKGYVVWVWDFSGLEGEWNYTLHVENLSVEKQMELDGTTKYRTNDDPYFMFPQTAYLNNLVQGSSTASGAMSGTTYYSEGRGTYVTGATENSLDMRAEIIYDQLDIDANATSKLDNPLGLYIPLKNVRYNTTYKVTFDFSVAKQGINGPNSSKTNGWISQSKVTENSSDWHQYSSHILNTGTIENAFQSYLAQISNLSAAGAAPNNKEAHKTLRESSFSYKNKALPKAPLTKYDEVTKYSDLNYTVSSSVNDTFSKLLNTSGDNTINRNFFNAVWHVEYNGQYEIPWLTFYNTTFSFNIPSGAGDYSKLEDLYWIWNIDALNYTAYYNIKIENVRIQEVVDYGSNIAVNGFKVGSTQISPLNETHVPYAGQDRTNETGSDHNGVDPDTGRDINAFANFKGRNGTGQNYRARGHVPKSTDHYFVKGNIYAPTVDASAFNAAAYGGTSTDAYKIYLKGWAVVDGGVRRYVFSVDGGKTWEDMTFNGGNATAEILADAEYNVDQFVQYQGVVDDGGGSDWITFDSKDALNGNFDNWTLCANLEKYKNQANLDIIIAAVPASNVNLRCEIVRIINYNPIRNYRTYANGIGSDIKVNSYQGYNINQEDSDYVTSNLSCNYLGLTKKDNKDIRYDFSENIEPYTSMYGVTMSGDVSSAGGYALRTMYSYDYADVRALFSDIPVYTSLKVSGYAIVEGGTEHYYWSADHGKTWFECTEVGVEGFDTLSSDGTLGNLNQRSWWYDHTVGQVKFTSGYEKNYFFGVNQNTKDYSRYIAADLTKYVGEVVDVIFAAKPIGSDVYCPVARVDNVGVYGTDGTFHTRIENVYLDGVKSCEESTSTIKHSTRRDKWFISYAVPGYSIYEPYNVNYKNMRFYNDPYQNLPVISSAGQVKIDGYTICKGGVKQYKFSLDGGDSWTVIYDTAVDKKFSTNEPRDAIRCEASFNETDFKNSDFDSDNEYLIFNIPAFEHGDIKDLIVVAEGENEKLYPVVKLRFQVVNYNYGYMLHDANGTEIGQYRDPAINGITQTFTTSSNPADLRYKITLPVSEAGTYYLGFNEDLDYVAQSESHPSTVSKNTYTNYRDDLILAGNTADTTNSDYVPAWAFGRGTVNMGVPQTQYAVGDKMQITYSWDVWNYHYRNNTYICERRPAINGAYILLYPVEDVENFTGGQPCRAYSFTGYKYETGEIVRAGQSPGSGSVDSNGHLFWGPNTSVLSDVNGYATHNIRNDTTIEFDLSNLPAGEYRLMFLNFGPDDIFNYNVEDVKSSTSSKYAPWQILTDEITIFINDSIDNTIVNQIVRDEDSEIAYWADTSDLAQTTDDRIMGSPWANDNHLDPDKVEHYFEVTEEDARRGYVVLDWNLTDLQANTNYELTMSNIVLEKVSDRTAFSRRLQTNAQGGASTEFVIPVTKTGTIDVSFSGTFSAEVTNKGVKSSCPNAYLSVPKTVFLEGETIPVSYSAKGSVNEKSNGPWIGIAATDANGIDRHVNWIYVDRESEGTVYLSANTVSTPEDNVAALVDLPAGNYKIYLREDSANITDFTNGSDLRWRAKDMVEPIDITIIDPEDPDYSMTNSFKYGGGTGYNVEINGSVKLPNGTTYYVGDEIPFEVSGATHITAGTNNEQGGSTWVYLAKDTTTTYTANDRPYYAWANSSAPGSISTVGLTPGNYVLYYLVGDGYNLKSAGYYNGWQMASIEITLLPAAAKLTAGKEGGSATTLTMKDYSTYQLSGITVTEEDVKRGYVVVDLSFADLSASKKYFFVADSLTVTEH